MGRISLKSQIVESGVTTVHKGGFSTSGVREITAAANVAQGSFTNHFASKDEFGVAVIEKYFVGIRGVIRNTLENDKIRPIARIKSYFDEITDLLENHGWRYGCLAGNMALEASEHSGLIREKLIDVFASWTPPFSKAIRDAQLAEEVPQHIDATETGSALLEAWQGAMLRMKIDRSPDALNRFKRLTLPALLSI
jgi:TetR/AcrR family transcriptional regulator, transcriptional repressor for nem operon